MQALDTARQTLLAQLEPIDTEAAELEARLSELNQDRSRLKAALKALDATKKPRSKPAKASRPSPKQQDVRDVAVALVTENPGIAKPDLEGLVKHKLTEELGFDLKGFEMRWNEVMGSDTFTLESGGAVMLAGDPSDETPGDRKSSGVA